MSQYVAKNTLFQWEGINSAGKIVNGEQKAINSRLLKANLRQQGITARKIKKKAQRFFSIRKIRNVEITIFTRQVTTMLAAGIPLIQTLNLISRSHNNPAMRQLINNLQTSIEQGNSIGNAMSQHPKYFNELYRNLVTAGEHSGALDILLDRLATCKEKTENLITKIKKALYYPIAIIIVALLVLIVLLVFVIPQFQLLYSGFNAVLPMPTQLVITLSKFIQSYGWMMLILIIIMNLIFMLLRRHLSEFNLFIDKLVLKMPLLGSIFAKSAIARFSRTLATTFAAGMPLITALQIVAGVTGNRIYMHAILKIRDNVIHGQSLHQSLQNVNLFPNIVVQMIAVGEESGALEKMLNKIADIFEQEVDHLVEGLGNLLEPFIMLVLGLFTGSFVIAMYLPIFKLGSVM